MTYLEILGFLWVFGILALIIGGIFLRINEPNIIELERKLGRFLYLFSHQYCDDFFIGKKYVTHFEINLKQFLMIKIFLLEIARENDFKKNELEKLEDPKRFSEIFEISKSIASEEHRKYFFSKQRKKLQEFREEFIEQYNKCNFDDEESIKKLKEIFVKIYNDL